MASHPAYRDRRPETDSGAFFKVAAVLLGFAVADRRLRCPRCCGPTRATLATTRARHSGDGQPAAHDHNAALPLNSFAGVVPANAQALPRRTRRTTRRSRRRRRANVAKVHMTLKDMTVQIAPGVKYNTWSFSGHGAPGPILHVRQGQTGQDDADQRRSDPALDRLPRRADRAEHRLPGCDPGKSFTFQFRANDPGVFMYHCGTKPVLDAHRERDVRRDRGQPDEAAPAGRQELRPRRQRVVHERRRHREPACFDMAKAHAMEPDWTTFNGYANQYVTHPLTAIPGETRPPLGRRRRADARHRLPRRRADLRPRLAERERHRHAAARRADRAGAGGWRRRLRREDRPARPLPVRVPRVRTRRPRQVGLLKVGHPKGTMSH